MKKILFLIVLVFINHINFAQEIEARVNSKSEGSISTEQKVPKESALYQYVARNYIIPDVPGLKGKVVVVFVVNENGSIGDFKIIEDLKHGTAQELIRVLKTTNGKWKPTIKDGKPVKGSYIFPININVPK